MHDAVLCFPFSIATIFAYGQTSSGKTFTMRGITENAVHDMYDYIDKVRITLQIDRSIDR